MGEIASLRDLRPGDLLFTNIGGVVPGIFPVGIGQLLLAERVRIGRLTFDHVAIVTRESLQLPPGTVRMHATGEYLSPPVLRSQLVAGSYDIYETGVLTAPRAVQAMPDGAEEIDLTSSRYWSERTAYARLPEDYPGQHLDAARIAEAMALADTPYSFASYLALALWRYGVATPRLEAWIDRRQPPKSIDLPVAGETVIELPAEAICSVLADQAWSLVGKRVIEGVSPQAVTPGKLGLQLLRRHDVVWGGPALS